MKTQTKAADVKEPKSRAFPPPNRLQEHRRGQAKMRVDEWWDLQLRIQLDDTPSAQSVNAIERMAMSAATGAKKGRNKSKRIEVAGVTVTVPASMRENIYAKESRAGRSSATPPSVERSNHQRYLLFLLDEVRAIEPRYLVACVAMAQHETLEIAAEELGAGLQTFLRYWEGALGVIMYLEREVIEGRLDRSLWGS